MNRAKQAGQAPDRIVEQGEHVETTDGYNGEIESFGGGSHTFVTIRDKAGYVHTTDTNKIKPRER